jgi:formamidopyrimidine-DNA glycosylase
MPEGPEVTVLVEQLHKLLNKKYLRSIKIVSGPYVSDQKPVFKETRERIQSLNRVLGRKTMAMRIDAVRKKGKFIYFELTRLEKSSDGCKQLPLYIGSSLGLTGHYRFLPPEEKVPSHIRLEFVFADHPKVGPVHTLYYTDQLSMGKLALVSKETMMAKLNSIGVDALSEEFTFDVFYKICQQSSAPVYMALVDQERISGIGNIYRSEIIYKARNQSNFDPFDPMKSLSDEKIRAIYDSIIDILTSATSRGGMSEKKESSYRDLYNSPGHYVPSIYGKTKTANGEPVLHIVDSDKRKFYYTSSH